VPTDESVSARIAPGFLPPEQLHHWLVEGSDGIGRRAYLYVPSGVAPLDRTTIPLVIVPHPFGFSALGNLFGEAAGPRTLVNVAGIAPAARRAGFAVLGLQSEGRRFTGMSVGLAAQLEAYAVALDRVPSLNAEIDVSRVGATGLSMGGQEALMLGATTLSDRISAIAIQNPVTDLAAWYRYLDARGALHAPALLSELGADPASVPEEWRRRSPADHIDALVSAGIPLLIRLNNRDEIVNADTQGRQLAEALRSKGANVDVVEDLPALHPSDPGRSAHEYADWDAMLAWIAKRL
jgi:predicted dienelactone hydrolase